MADDNNLNNLNQDFDKLRSMASQISNIYDEMNSGVKKGYASTRKVINDIAKAQQEVLAYEQSGIKNQRDLESFNKKVLEVKKKQLRIDVERAILMERVKTASDRQLKTIMQSLEGLLDTEETLKNGAKAFEGIANYAEATAKKVKDFSAIKDALHSLPGVGPLLSKSMQKATDAVAATGSRAAGVLSIFTSIAETVGPAAILKSMLEVSNQTRELSKNLGIGMDSAREIRKEYSQISADSNDSAVNSEKLLKAQTAISTSLNVIARFSGESLKNFIQISNLIGVSEEAAAKLELYSAATGQSSKEFSANLAVAANESGKTYGIHLPLSKVIEGISKMQAATLAYIVDQPAALVKSVAIADKLGMSFEKIRNIADGLTNFEQSITSELEAEVFLGRDINLNKARQLAFLGKEAELGEEILKQVGSLSDFQSMLPIQQESFAKALGMSRDELGGVLMRQELLNKLGREAADLSDEQLRRAEKMVDKEGLSKGEALKRIQAEVSATEKFQQAADKMKVALQDLVVKITPLVEQLANFMAKFASGPLGKLTVGAFAIGGTLLAGLKAVRGATPFMPLFTSNVGMGGTGGGLMRTLPGGSRYGAAMRMSRAGKFGLSRGMGGAMGLKGVGIGAVAGLAGMAVDSFANDAAAAGKEGLASGLGAAGGALKYGGMGAMIGSVIPVIGTGVGAAIGALYGGVTGYLDKQEAAREAKREQIQKEIDERGAVADELRQINKLLSEAESGVYIDGDRVGMSLLKGASMPKASYEL